MTHWDARKSNACVFTSLTDSKARHICRFTIRLDGNFV